MSLELLHSNVMRDADAADVPYTELVAYDDEMGWFISYITQYYVGTMDGVFFPKSELFTNVFRVCLDVRNPAEWLVYPGSGTTLYRFNKQACVFTGVTEAGVANQHVRCIDRFIAPGGHFVFATPLGGGSAVAEYTFADMDLSVGTGRMFFTDEPNVVGYRILEQHGGDYWNFIVFYDYVLKTEVGTRKYLPIQTYNNIFNVWFSHRWNVYVCQRDLYTDDVSPVFIQSEVLVFATTVVPAIISEVEVVPGTFDTVHWIPGVLTPVRVRVTGDQDDPCEGELVGWALTSGVGSMLYAQSETDVDGYAYNRHIGPIGGSGDIEITVEVKY